MFNFFTDPVPRKNIHPQNPPINTLPSCPGTQLVPSTFSFNHTGPIKDNLQTSVELNAGDNLSAND